MDPNIDLELSALRTALDYRLDLPSDLFAGDLHPDAAEFVCANRPLTVAQFVAAWPASMAVLKRDAAGAVAGSIRDAAVLRTSRARGDAVRELTALRDLRLAAELRDDLEAAIDDDDGAAARELLDRRRSGTEAADGGDYIRDYEWRRKQLEIRVEHGHLIPTGFREVDRRLGGVARGEVFVVFGPSGTGKSIFLLNVAAAAWLHGYRVYHYGLEMSRLETETRLDTLLTQISAKRFRTGLSDEDVKLWDREMRRYKKKYLKKGSGSGIYFASGRGVPMERVFSEMEAAEADLGTFDLLIVDWLGLVGGARRGEMRHDKETRNAAELCSFARERDVAVWSGGQMTDEEQRSKSGVRLTGFKYGRGVIELGHGAFALIETETDRAGGVQSLHCLKARSGAKGWKIELLPDHERMLACKRCAADLGVHVMRGGRK